MIKIIYIASTPVLLVLILIFLLLFMSYRPFVINPEMTRKTEILTKNSPSLDSSELSVKSPKPQIPSEVWTNNIFDPSRATASGDSGSSNLSIKDLTLLGVFGDGPMAGGVFSINTPGGTPGGMRPYGSAPQTEKMPPKPKMVFLIGERLPNGLLIKSVERDSVTLEGSGGPVTLNIQFGDEASVKRLSETQKQNLQQQAKIIESGKQSSTGGTGSGSSSSVVTRNIPDRNQ